jgi:hypothetical protein
VLQRITQLPARRGRPGVFVLTLVEEDVPSLVAALRKRGRPAHGLGLEAAVVRIAESNDSPWASELDFDSEADACVVRCARRAPLVHLARRLEKRLTSPTALRRLVRSVPREP